MADQNANKVSFLKRVDIRVEKIFVGTKKQSNIATLINLPITALLVVTVIELEFIPIWLGVSLIFGIGITTQTLITRWLYHRSLKQDHGAGVE